MNKDSLGDRMKVYEDAYRLHLPIRMPIILRIDGKAFHSYTKGCKKPVDENLTNCMNETAHYLCKNIQGAQLAYVQSDEISLLLVNYKNLDSSSWFENNLQKMASVSASMAGAVFTSLSHTIFGKTKIATFDSRAFVLPKEEVCNYFIWRQQDATRNSVQMLARSLYSHKQCNNKNNAQLQEMCFQKGINWNDCSTSQKRGRCIVKAEVNKPVTWNGSGPVTAEQRYVTRSEWTVDNDIPIFSQNRKYIEEHAYPLMTYKVESVNAAPGQVPLKVEMSHLDSELTYDDYVDSLKNSSLYEDDIGSAPLWMDPDEVDGMLKKMILPDEDPDKRD